MAEQGAEVDLGLDKIKSLLHQGEVWITNAEDEKSESWKMRVHRKDEKSGQQFAKELDSYKERGGKWDKVRIVSAAFDREGNPIKGMVALVGTPKKK